MAKRWKMSKSSSKKLFSRTGGNRHMDARNAVTGSMRGGIRL